MHSKLFELKEITKSLKQMLFSVFVIFISDVSNIVKLINNAQQNYVLKWRYTIIKEKPQLPSKLFLLKRNCTFIRNQFIRFPLEIPIIMKLPNRYASQNKE